MLVNLFDFYTELRKKGFVFCFSGPTSQSILEGIGDALRQKMEREDAGAAISQKVFSIFVEQMQNVVHYSAEKIDGDVEGGSELRYGMVAVGEENGKFFVLSGNFIALEEAGRLSDQLSRLRTMTKEEMKAFFKEQRRREAKEGSKGAGLGFIETARKASEPLEFEITPVDEKRAFFSIKASI